MSSSSSSSSPPTSVVVLATLGTDGRLGAAASSTGGWRAYTARDRTDAKRILFEIGGGTRGHGRTRVFPTHPQRVHHRHYLCSLPDNEQQPMQAILQNPDCLPSFSADAYWLCRARPRTADDNTRRAELDYVRPHKIQRPPCFVDDDGKLKPFHRPLRPRPFFYP